MPDKYYNKAFETNRAAPVFTYVEDLTLNGGSGLWRPLRPSDFVGGETTINVSGIDQLIVDTDELESIGHSGNAFAAPAQKAFTAGFANSLLAKNGAGTLYSINGYTSYTGLQYLFVYDNITSGNLINIVGMGVQDNFSVDFGSVGLQMNSGIYVTNSLSASQLVQGAADCFITISFK